MNELMTADDLLIGHLVFLPVNVLDERDLVKVDDDPWQVAHHEHEGHDHQHLGLLVLPPPPPSPSPDRDVDLGVDDADNHEGEDAQHQQPRTFHVQ